MRATVKVAPTNTEITSLFVGATFTVALVAWALNQRARFFQQFQCLSDTFFFA